MGHQNPECFAFGIYFLSLDFSLNIVRHANRMFMRFAWLFLGMIVMRCCHNTVHDSFFCSISSSGSPSGMNEPTSAYPNLR